MTKHSLSLPERFYLKVDTTGDCHIWTAAKQSKGYGRFHNPDGTTVTAHAFAYVMAYGSIPENMMICHTCDVKLCVRPEHLYAGTHSENVQDAIDRKRYKSGEDHFVTINKGFKTESRAREALLRVRSGESQASVARDMGISSSSVGDLVNGRTWKWLTQD